MTISKEPINLGGCHNAELSERLGVWSKEIMRSAQVLKGIGEHLAADGNERLAGDLVKAQAEIRRLEGLLENPAKHDFWSAGEPDCPCDIKAGNGELHTLQCKLCGKKNPLNGVCNAHLEGDA